MLVGYIVATIDRVDLALGVGVGLLLRNGDLADGDAGTGEEVQLVSVLQDPASGCELPVDGYSGERFRFGHNAVTRLGLSGVVS
jgi:hypothetical protein